MGTAINTDLVFGGNYCVKKSVSHNNSILRADVVNFPDLSVMDIQNSPMRGVPVLRHT